MMNSSFPSRVNDGDKNKSSTSLSSSSRHSKKHFSPESSVSKTRNLSLAKKDKAAVSFPLSLSCGGPGDHPLIHEFLRCTLQKPSAAEFHAQLEDPLYEPTDRLLIKRDFQIVGHIRLTKREMRFGSLISPVADLHELAILPEYHQLPEYHRQECANALVGAAEKKMFDDGAEIGFVKTISREPYQSRGWAICGKPCYSRAGARDILSHLRSLDKKEVSLFAPVQTPLSIRIWRHVERAALRRLYHENTHSLFGASVRSEAHWRWLLSRHAYDRIYVAIHGPDKFDLDESCSPIVGYAAMKEGRIVEMLTSPDHPEAPLQLLDRACRDTIERDDHDMRLDAPADHPLHRIITAAGREGRTRERVEGECYMVKFKDPLSFLKQLTPLLLQRSVEAKLTKAYDLGLLVGNDKYQLKIEHNRLKVLSGKLGRSYLTCPENSLPQLLLGSLNVRYQIEQGYLEASTQIAAQTAERLFPRLPFWRPAWDDLPA